jgi:hypothetical protein
MDRAFWGEQDEYGSNLAQLLYNLTLSDEEKIARHQRAAHFVLECMLAADRSGIRRSTESI